MTDRTDDRVVDRDGEQDRPGKPVDEAIDETVYVPADAPGAGEVFVPAGDDDPQSAGRRGAPTDGVETDDDFAAWFDREFDEPVDRDGQGSPEELVVEPIDDDDWRDDAGPDEPDDDEAAGPTPAPWHVRAGRRIIRRPSAWVSAPWPADRVVRVTVTMVSLVITTVVMMNVVHLNPLSPSADLIFDDNTPTGGDMGAHVWGPAYLRDHLLTNFQLNGWSMDWYAGMPAYRFYMVLPALGMVALDTILPYGTAFKLIAVVGLVALPASCWAFGRLARFRYPMPELFAFAGLCFALDESFSIYGGNVKSTMAGEFSFSIALALGILGLGLLANGMRTGKYRSWAGILLAAGAVSHGIVLIFIALSAIVIFLVWVDSRRRLVYGLTTGLATLLLMAWWVGPFVFDHDYMTDMKYGSRPDGATDSFWAMFFPLEATLDVLIMTFAVVGFAACVARRHATGTALGVIGLLLVALVYATQDSLPVIGLLWNPRLLPFIYLVRYLLMMIGIVELGALIANLLRNRPARALPGLRSTTIAAGTAIVAVLLVLGFMYEVLPGGGRRTEHDANVYAWGPLRKPSTAGDAQGNGWSKYNFEGYENRPLYAEYHDVVTTMEELGRTNGCGRATWENNEENGKYGTTMALMLLPHWTDGCIASMEGLFFEASGTTPYHFLTTAAISANSSNPVRELRYVDTDADVGVRHLRDLGVRYLMVRTPEAKAEAAGHDALTMLAESGPWEIYEVERSQLVVPLRVRPVVVEGRGGDQRERNLELGTSYFQQREDWAALPADDGPPEWQRVEVEVDETRQIPELDRPADNPDTRGKQVDIVVPSTPIERTELPRVRVSDVDVGDQDLSFRVDRVGVPVLVKVSYFPNWEVEGAEGPYRVAPNMMVVVPTEQDVRLYYGRTNSDVAFYVLTLAGIAMLILMRRRGDLEYALNEYDRYRAEDRMDDAPMPPPPPTGALDIEPADLPPPPPGMVPAAHPDRAPPDDEFRPPPERHG